MQPKIIILDFDGTIVESVGIKDWAFEELFKEYPEHRESILRYHIAHNATIRYEKFRHITQNILGEPYDTSVENALSKKFSELVFQRIATCPYVQGVEEYLRFFYDRVPLYMISMSPLEELTRIFKTRNIDRYFKKIYTYPWKKKDALLDILVYEGAQAQSTIFIGDTREDYEAARATGVPFIGRCSTRLLGDVDAPIFQDFFGIREYIKTL